MTLCYQDVEALSGSADSIRCTVNYRHILATKFAYTDGLGLPGLQNQAQYEALDKVCIPTRLQLNIGRNAVGIDHPQEPTLRLADRKHNHQEAMCNLARSDHGECEEKNMRQTDQPRSAQSVLKIFPPNQSTKHISNKKRLSTRY